MEKRIKVRVGGLRGPVRKPSPSVRRPSSSVRRPVSSGRKKVRVGVLRDLVSNKEWQE